MDIKREYPTYEAIEEHIRRARLERSVALGNMIAGLVLAAVRGVGAAASEPRLLSCGRPVDEGGPSWGSSPLLWGHVQDLGKTP